METIEFTEADEQMELPPPMSLSELENMSLAQKRMNAMVEPEQEEKPGDAEMEVRFDVTWSISWHDYPKHFFIYVLD